MYSPFNRHTIFSSPFKNPQDHQFHLHSLIPSVLNSKVSWYLQELVVSGILYIDKFDWQYVLINKYCKAVLEKTYNQLLIDFFATPYTAYLQGIGLEIVDKSLKETIGIIELLIFQGLGPQEIAYQLGLAERSDPDQLRHKARSDIRG